MADVANRYPKTFPANITWTTSALIATCAAKRHRTTSSVTRTAVIRSSISNPNRPRRRGAARKPKKAAPWKPSATTARSPTEISTGPQFQRLRAFCLAESSPRRRTILSRVSIPSIPSYSDNKVRQPLPDRRDNHCVNNDRERRQQELLRSPAGSMYSGNSKCPIIFSRLKSVKSCALRQERRMDSRAAEPRSWIQ